MKTLKKIDPMSYAKISGVMGAVIGLIMGLTFSSLSGFLSIFGAEAAGMMGGLGLLSIMVFPILYAIMGFISGLIGAFIYNIVAGYVGGVKVDLE